MASLSLGGSSRRHSNHRGGGGGGGGPRPPHLSTSTMGGSVDKGKPSNRRRQSLVSHQPAPAIVHGGPSGPNRFQLPDYYYFNRTPPVCTLSAAGPTATNANRRESAAGFVFNFPRQVSSDKVEAENNHRDELTKQVSEDRSHRSLDPLLGNNTKVNLRVDLADVTPSSSSKTFRCFASECNCFVAYLLLGMVGFVAFWSVLMLRIYLPERYWEWSYIWR